MVEVEVAGELLQLRADRTLFWPSERTLFVADLHLGKGAAIRSLGVPIPQGSTAATLEALDRAVCATGASRVAILGDLWHAREGRTEENQQALLAWRERHPELEIDFVIGNHDRRSGWEFEPFDEGTRRGPFALRHHPEPVPGAYVLCGHLHPAVRLSGASDSIRLPCFWFGEDVGVIPAFGELTGTAVVRPKATDQTFAIADGQVIPLGPRDRFGSSRR